MLHLLATNNYHCSSNKDKKLFVSDALHIEYLCALLQRKKIKLSNTGDAPGIYISSGRRILEMSRQQKENKGICFLLSSHTGHYFILIASTL